MMRSIAILLACVIAEIAARQVQNVEDEYLSDNIATEDPRTSLLKMIMFAQSPKLIGRRDSRKFGRMSSIGMDAVVDKGTMFKAIRGVVHINGSTYADDDFLPPAPDYNSEFGAALKELNQFEVFELLERISCLPIQEPDIVEAMTISNVTEKVGSVVALFHETEESAKGDAYDLVQMHAEEMKTKEMLNELEEYYASDEVKEEILKAEEAAFKRVSKEVVELEADLDTTLGHIPEPDEEVVENWGKALELFEANEIDKLKEYVAAGGADKIREYYSDLGDDEESVLPPAFKEYVRSSIEGIGDALTEMGSFELVIKNLKGLESGKDTLNEEEIKELLQDFDGEKDFEEILESSNKTSEKVEQIYMAMLSKFNSTGFEDLMGVAELYNDTDEVATLDDMMAEESMLAYRGDGDEEDTEDPEENE